MQLSIIRPFLIFGLATVVASIGSVSQADAIDVTISQYFHRVTGLTARMSDISSLRAKTVNQSGKLDENRLFSLLFADDGFLENRLATFASRMNNEEGEPFQTVDDFQTSVLLAVQNNIDFRDLLTKPYQIENINAPGVPIAADASTYAIGTTSRITGSFSVPRSSL